MRSPISYYDSRTRHRAPVRARRRWSHRSRSTTRAGDVLELGRITVWEPGVKLQWLSSVDDVEVDVRFAADRQRYQRAGATRVCCPAETRTSPAASPSCAIVPDWFVKWCARRDTASREIRDLSRLNLAAVLPQARRRRPLARRPRSGSIRRCSRTDDDADGRGSSSTSATARSSSASTSDDRRGAPVTHMPLVYVDDLDAHFAHARGMRARRSSNRSTSTATAPTSPRTSRVIAGRSRRPDPRWSDVISRLRARNEWKFFAVAAQGRARRSRRRGGSSLLAARRAPGRCSPIAMGVLVGAVQHGDSLGGAARAHWAACSSLLQVLSPIHQAVSANLGSRTATWLHDRLMRACVRAARHGAPRAPGARERPRDGARLRPRHHRSAARDRAGLHRDRARRHGRRHRAGDRARRLRVVGAARCSAARGRRRTGCCARARSGATATPTRCARRSATPTTRTGSRSTRPRRRSSACSASRTGRSSASSAAGAGCSTCNGARRGCASGRCCGALVLVLGRERRRVLVAGRRRRVRRASASARLVVFATAAVGTSSIAFGGLNWALDGASQPVAAALRLERVDGRRSARSPPASPRRRRTAGARDPRARPHVRVRGRRAARCSTASTSRSRPARRSRSSARTARARRRSPSCCAGSTTRSAARSRSTASTSASSTSTPGATRVTAVFQDFIRYELLAARQRRARRRARRRRSAPRCARPARPVSPTSTRSWRAATRAAPTSPAVSGNASRSPRALCAVRLGAGVVLLDEPTAQLDVRGEAEIFDRILAATRDCTTILDLAPLLDRAPRRSHLRARRRPGRRARHARRADGARTGATARCSTCRRRASATTGQRGGVL